MSNNKKNKNTGFTLIEILISVGIIAILSATMLQVTSISNTQKQLTIEVSKAQSFLRMAQSYSLSIPQDVVTSTRHICGFGFYPATEKDYKVFYVYNENFNSNPEACENESNYTPSSSIGSEIIEEASLSGDYEFASFGVSKAVFFKAPYGRVYESGGPSKMEGADEHSFEIKDGGDSREIKINGGGKIKVN
ncbi:MAG: type II secretion system protein [Candidatus Moraniibacteriota bacterium]